MTLRLGRRLRRLALVLALLSSRPETAVRAADETGLLPLETPVSSAGSPASGPSSPEPTTISPEGALPEPFVANTGPAAASSGLTPQEVERIVADYLAKRERERALAADFASQAKSADVAAPPQPTTIGSDTKMSGSWKDGGQLETADKAFKMKWRGRTQFDTIGFLNGSEAAFRGLGGNQGDATVDFRRLRLGAEGVFYEQFDFAVELDLANSFNTNGSTNAFAPNNNLKNAFDRQFFGVPAPTDVWVGRHEIPLVGNIRVGSVKPPNGLEHSNSSRFLDFMERSLNQDAFVGRFNNGFQPGLLQWNWNEAQTATHAFSCTANSYNVFSYEAGGVDVCNRFTWTPYYDEESEGRYLLHLGCSLTQRTPVDGQQRIRARGSLSTGVAQSWSNVADTTIFFTDYEVLLVPEVAAVLGPLHLQAEYFGQWNRDVKVQQPGGAPNPGPDLGTAYFQGWYVQATYFLTGEHREYERKTGSFGRVKPFENFHFIRGTGGPIWTRGAWQVGYRYCLLDLRDPTLNLVNAVGGGLPNVGGGTVHDHTFGLNHFLNPNMKLQYNFVISDRSPSAATPATPGQTQTGGVSYGLGVRLAHDF